MSVYSLCFQKKSWKLVRQNNPGLSFLQLYTPSGSRSWLQLSMLSVAKNAIFAGHI